MFSDLPRFWLVLYPVNFHISCLTTVALGRIHPQAKGDMKPRKKKRVDKKVWRQLIAILVERNVRIIYIKTV